MQPDDHRSRQRAMTTATADRRRFDLRAGALCVVAGILIAAAVPPWGWWPAAFAGFGLLDHLVAEQTRRRRFARGWLTTAAWILPSIVWMQDLTLPGYVVAGLFYPLYYGLACAVSPADHRRHLALPAAITLAELARWSWPFGGVPLSTIAMGQAGSPLAQLVRLFGSLLLVFSTVAIGCALAAALHRRWHAAGALVGGVAVAFIVALFAPAGEAIGTLDVAIVQGGGPQNTRAVNTSSRDVFDRHLEASDDIALPVDLVVWPENVVNVEGAITDNAYEFENLANLARRTDAVLVPGIVEGLNEDDFENISVVFEPDGRLTDRYVKVQRVPFGEYVPLRSFVAPLSGGSVDRFIPREATEGFGEAVLESSIGPIGTVISWEVFFPHRARDAIGNGGEILINPTNGSSYWLAIVQSQQVASSRLRALETGRWVLQAAPTGFSALITPDGEIVDRTGITEQRVISGTIERRTGLTIANRVGEWPMLIISLLLLLATTNWKKAPLRVR